MPGTYVWAARLPIQRKQEAERLFPLLIVCSMYLRVQLSAGGGLTVDNLERVVRESGAREFHGSFSRQTLQEEGTIQLGTTRGGNGNVLRRTDAGLVRQAAALLTSATQR